MQRNWIGLVFGFTLVFTLPVSACKYDADSLAKRTLQERLQESPIAFIGTVMRVSMEGDVEFRVEHPLQGKFADPVFLLHSEGTSCDIKFSLGQQWIYGGPKLYDPSRLLLENQDSSVRSLVRLNDARLNFPIQWQACIDDQDCVFLAYGCEATAVQKNHLPEAKEHAWLIAGDPRAISCPIPPASEFDKVLCWQQRCGIMSLQH